MADTSIHRISKVVKELNVRLGTLVDFLNGKGQMVDNNPNAKITGEQYDMLVTAFQHEKTLKEEAMHISTAVKERKESQLIVEKPKSSEPLVLQKEIATLPEKTKETQPPEPPVKAPEIIKAKVEKKVEVKIVSKIDLKTPRSNLKIRPSQSLQAHSSH